MLAVLVVLEAEVVVDEDEVVEVEELVPDVVPASVPEVLVLLVEGEEPSVLVLVPVLVELDVPVPDEPDGVEEDVRGISVRVMEEHEPLPGLKESRRASLGGQYKK